MGRRKKKKKVTKYLMEATSIMDGPIKEVIKTLLGLEQEYKDKGFSDIYGERGVEYEWDHSYSTYSLYGTREETDKEYDRRLKSTASARARAKKDKMSKEEREKVDLKKLMKKYPEVAGNKNE